MDYVLNQEIISNISAHTNITSIHKLEALDEPFQSLIMILYSLTAVFAFTTNILALLMLIDGKRTSFTLKKYLANLAFVDLFLAVFSIPFSYTDFMFGRWLFPLCLCPIMNFITTCAVIVHIYTLIAIGLGRYFAIVNLFKSVLWFETRSTAMIVSIWLFGITLGSPLLYHTKAVSFSYSNQTYYDCRELWEQTLSSKIYSCLLFVILFVFPLLSLTVIYGSIGIKLFRKKTPGIPNCLRDEIQHQIRIKVLKMLIILVIAFAICWFPLQFFNLIIWLFDDLREPQSLDHYYAYVCAYFVCHWLSTAHSFINPFIYCLMSSNYDRIDIKQLLRNSFSKRSARSFDSNKS